MNRLLAIWSSPFFRHGVLAFALGAALDFVVNGVLKVVWVIVYGTLYLAVAGETYNVLLRGRFRPVARALPAAFLVGALAGHLALDRWTQTRIYPMRVAGEAPLALESADFADRLIVASEKVRESLAARAPAPTVPVAMQVSRSYGCITSFKAMSVAGVDIQADPEASWVWKPRPGSGGDGASSASSVSSGSWAGMQEENRRIPWCRIHWF